MNFTIFTPTRGRVELLKQGLDKIQENTKFLDKIEALYWVDSDDWPTIDFFQKNIGQYLFNIKFFIKERPESLNAALNFLASCGTGRYLTNYNDDALIITKNWDEIILNKIESYKEQKGIKDDIIYCKTGDNSIDRDKDKGYASFPVTSRQCFGIIGMYMYQNFKGLGGDSSLVKIFQELDRIINCEEVEYDHVFHSNLFRVMSPDIVAAEMRAKSHQYYVDPYAFDVSKEVSKLKEFINNYK